MPSGATSAAVPLTIGVADVDQILQGSLAGKSVRAQAEKYDEKFQKQTAAEESALRAAKQELDQHPQAASQDGLAEKVRTFELNFADFQSRYTARRHALEKSLNAAMAKVQQGMIDATQRVAAARGVTLVLPGAQVLLASDKLNLTKEIIATMDKMLPRVEFPLPNVDAELAQSGVAKEGFGSGGGVPFPHEPDPLPVARKKEP